MEVENGTDGSAQNEQEHPGTIPTTSAKVNEEGDIEPNSVTLPAIGGTNRDEKNSFFNHAVPMHEKSTNGSGDATPTDGASISTGSQMAGLSRNDQRHLTGAVLGNFPSQRTTSDQGVMATQDPIAPTQSGSHYRSSYSGELATLNNAGKVSYNQAAFLNTGINTGSVTSHASLAGITQKPTGKGTKDASEVTGTVADKSVHSDPHASTEKAAPKKRAPRKRSR